MNSPKFTPFEINYIGLCGNAKTTTVRHISAEKARELFVANYQFREIKTVKPKAEPQAII